MSDHQKSQAAKYLEEVKNQSNGRDFYTRGSAVSSFPHNNSLYMRLREKLRKVQIDGEILYVAEGDTLLDEAQLEIYSLQKEAANRVIELDRVSDAAGLGRALLTDQSTRGLIGITEGGKLVRWQPGLVLSYCVLKNTFATGDANYKAVCRSLEMATRDWEETCGISFEHKQHLDDSISVNPQDIGVVFVVREFNAGGNFIASAFFPNDPVYRRRLLIDPTYYSTHGFDKVGVLRHELGHVIGLRHEHIRRGAPSSCPDEAIENTEELTRYDSKSVMHYLCGDVGDPMLRISPLDKEGVQKIYGPPLTVTMFVS